MAKRTTTTNALDGEEVRVREQAGELKGDVRDEHGRLLYWARRPFGYNGEDLDRGQVLGLQGAVNDRKLDRLGYIVALRKSDELLACRYCGARFIDLNTLNAHGGKRHQDKDHRPDVPWSARGATVDETAAQAQQFEREQTQMDQIAPLNLDRTEANRGARA